MACDWFDPKCIAAAGAKAVLDGVIEDWARAIAEGVGKVVASVGTMWVDIPTPDLAGGDAPAAVEESVVVGSTVLTFLSYITWISFGVAALALIILAVMMTMQMRRGEGARSVGRLGVILGAVILIGAAGGLVSGLVPNSPVGVGGAAGFLQGHLWWIMLAVAVGATIVGAARMAWEMRAKPGQDILTGIIRLVVVSSAGIAFVSLLISIADTFSVWILDASLDCSMDDSACFGTNISALLILTGSTGSALGPLLVIVIGLVAMFASMTQIVLMLARSGALVIFAGLLPVASASAMAGPSGLAWFNKIVAWLIAFVLYKPAAAIVYAVAFQLAGADVFSGDGKEILSVMTGVMMLALAIVALPAMMRMVTPLVAAVTGSGGGAGGAALAAGAAAALPSGAAQLGRLLQGSGGDKGSTPSTPQGSSSSPASSKNGSSGLDGGQGTGGKNGSTGGPGSGAPSGQAQMTPPGPDAASGAASGGAASGGARAAAGGAGAAASGAGAGAAAGAGGGVAAGAAAGAAGGPVGAAAGAAIGVGKQIGGAAAGAAKSVGDHMTGEGPSGSN